jgi:hypothetical protein
MYLNENGQSSPQRQRRWWRSLWFELALGVVLTVCILLVAATVYVSRHAGPILRERIIETLSARFHSPVELDSVGVSLVRGVEVRGHGLRVLYLAGSSAATPAPMLTVKDFAFRTSLRDLVHLRRHIANVDVDGMEIHIPPHHGIRLQQTSSHATEELLVDRIHCKDAKIIIETDKPSKEPLVLDIQNLVLTNVVPKQPFSYTADLINPKPVGMVHATGTFGPWQGAEPRSTPIDGEYSFSHADLSTIKGISGMLSSTGQFSGQLGNIIIDGVTHTPDFALDISNHPLPLETQFHAVVDGTTGDTALDPVNARLLHTSFSCTGLVARVPGKGHDIVLEVKMPSGRIEDMLTLALKSGRPVMTATVATHARLHIPPGPERVAQKIQLSGELVEHGINFTNPKTQDEIDALSMRAQGHPKNAREAGSDHKPEVVSTLTANFAYTNEFATFNSVQFTIPGAKVQLAGVFAVPGERFDFKGHVRTDATASQMTTGWKAMLLKPVDPFLKRNGAGLELPIEISGTKDDVHFGLALHGTDESPQSMAAEMRARRGSAHE